MDGCSCGKLVNRYRKKIFITIIYIQRHQWLLIQHWSPIHSCLFAALLARCKVSTLGNAHLGVLALAPLRLALVCNQVVGSPISERAKNESQLQFLVTESSDLLSPIFCRTTTKNQTMPSPTHDGILFRLLERKLSRVNPICYIIGLLERTRKSHLENFLPMALLLVSATILPSAQSNYLPTGNHPSHHSYTSPLWTERLIPLIRNQLVTLEECFF